MIAAENAPTLTIYVTHDEYLDWYRFSVHRGDAHVTVGADDAARSGPRSYRWFVAGTTWGKSRSEAIATAAKQLIGTGWAQDDVDALRAEIGRQIQSSMTAARAAFRSAGGGL